MGGQESKHFFALRGNPWARLLLFAVLLALGPAAPQPAAAQTGAITGFVVDNVNNPVPNATVRAISGPSAGLQATTTANGAYTLSNLRAGRYIFRASRSGYSTESRTINVTAFNTQRVDFSLQQTATEGGAVEGTVTRRDTGAPVPGVLVEIESNTFSQSATTNASGVFRINSIPTGTYRLTYSREGFVEVARTINVRSGQVTTANAVMTARAADLGSLQGEVRDENGDPVTGALVRLASGASRGQFATTNARGAYLINNIVPDTYSVEFSRSGFATQTISNVVVPPSTRVTLNAALVPQGGATASIEGTVSGTFGQVLQGATVEIIGGPVDGPFDVTDANGVYRIRNLLPGTYTLLADATGFNPLQGTATVTDGGQTTLNFTLQTGQTGAGTITGTITDGSGDPVPDVDVRITDGPIRGRVTTSDVDGEYTIQDLPPGVYTVTFTPTGGETVTISGIALASNETEVRNVTLDGGSGDASLTGLVRDEDSQPIVGVTVELFLNGDSVATGTTNSSGRYTLSGLDAGTYIARFTKTGYQTRIIQNVRLDAGLPTTLNVTMATSDDDTARVIGHVIDTSGRDIPEAIVTLVGPTGTRTRTTTDGEGRFEFDDVAIGGPYSVEVTATGMEPSTQGPLNLAAGDERNLTFILSSAPGGGGLAGRVTRSNGLPIAGATVRIVAGPARGATRTTNAEGEFNFAALPPGTYGVVAQASGFRPQRRNVVVRAGNSSVVVFRLVPTR